MAEKKYILDHEGKAYRKYFEEISWIPRDSFEEKEVAEYIVEFAKRLGLWYFIDENWNVLVKKPASPGYENKPPVLIQAHTDMICVKTPDSKHDFTKDPLELYVEDGWLKARGTSLGADNGAGVAQMMAILEDNTLKHPPLEAFFSVQEENGLGGARKMDYSHFESKHVISTDILYEGVNYQTTATAIGGDFIRPVKFENSDKATLTLKVHKCTGGHAALNVTNDPANGIKCCCRVLYNIFKAAPSIRLADITGGTARNNVPTQGIATFTYDEADFAKIEAVVNEQRAIICKEFAFTDPEMTIDLVKADKAAKVLTKDESDAVINYLYVLPTGVYYRSLKHNLDVFTSTNTGLIEFKEDKLIIGKMFRGAAFTIVEDLKQQVEVLSALFNSKYYEEYRYPGVQVPDWSKMSPLFADIYREFTGKEMVPVNMHGGNELGTMVQELGGPDVVDVVSIGVEAHHLHTFDECMELASFDRVYQYIVTFLERM